MKRYKTKLVFSGRTNKLVQERPEGIKEFNLQGVKFTTETDVRSSGGLSDIEQRIQLRFVNPKQSLGLSFAESGYSDSMKVAEQLAEFNIIIQQFGPNNVEFYKEIMGGTVVTAVTFEGVIIHPGVDLVMEE